MRILVRIGNEETNALRVALKDAEQHIQRATIVAHDLRNWISPILILRRATVENFRQC